MRHPSTYVPGKNGQVLDSAKQDPETQAIKDILQFLLISSHGSIPRFRSLAILLDGFVGITDNRFLLSKEIS